MKKLLALILCVAMVLSIAPAAFAETPGDDITLGTASEYTKQINNMIKNTKKNVEKAYKVLAGDQSVYNTAKAMDDMVVGLVDGIADSIIGKKVLGADYSTRWTKANTDAVKTAFRKLIDDKVATKFEENKYKTLDKDGNVDPLKYAQVFADSVSSVLTNKDLVKGYEAVATYFAVLNLVDSINTELKDQYTAFKDSAAGTSFDTNFAARYPKLADTKDFIDTFAENGGAFGSAQSEAWIQYLLATPGAITD